MKPGLRLISALLWSLSTQMLGAELQHLPPYPPYPPYAPFPTYHKDSVANQDLPGCYLTESTIPLQHYVDDDEYDDDNDDRHSTPQFYKYKCTNMILTTGQPLQEITGEHYRVGSLKFENCTISLIPVGVLTEFPNLLELYLNNSFVSSIHPGAFTGLMALQQLDLQDNNITTITKGIFNSLPHLQTLNLSNNHIDIIEENAFLGLFSLQIINLKNNNLKELLPKKFHGLDNLREIDFSYNLLSIIPLNLFTDLFGLDIFISLANNNFSKIDFSVFPKNVHSLALNNNHINYIENWSHVLKIVVLDLSNNTLKNISDLHETLEYINLSENLFEVVSNSMFERSKNLLIINLSHNLLKHLNENTFEGLRHLINLYLQNNHIMNIPIGLFKDLQSLTQLNLSNNELTEFEYGTFSGLGNLTILDISNNKLTSLYESSFHDLKALEVVNIKNNLISTFDPHDLADHSRHLKTIFLNNNPWVCKSLLNIVKILEYHNVTIIKGSTIMKTANVRGNACLNSNVYNTLPTFITPHYKNDIGNASIAKLYAVSSEMNAIKKFFDNDFLNSSFYKYFENFKNLNSTVYFNASSSKAFLKYFDDGFKNTTFYNYFKNDLVNNSFFERFNAASEKLSVALNSLDMNLKNSSSYNFVKFDLINQNISKYFDNGFQNSGFYKYFNKEFSHSEFFKYFDKTFQMRIDSNLLKIRNYFDNNFKNSTFFKFFSKTLQPNFNHSSDLNTNVARLIDNSPQVNTNDFVAKISELTDAIKAQEDAMQSSRAGTAVFMTFIVIILLGITFLLAINNIRTGFKRNVCKTVSENSESQMHITHAELELM